MGIKHNVVMKTEPSPILWKRGDTFIVKEPGFCLDEVWIATNVIENRVVSATCLTDGVTQTFRLLKPNFIPVVQTTTLIFIEVGQ
jgi:hypothetical protein